MGLSKFGGNWWSVNEIFAMKKNLLEDVKLRTAQRGIQIQEAVTRNRLEATTTKVKAELRNIRMSSGYSKEVHRVSSAWRGSRGNLSASSYARSDDSVFRASSKCQDNRGRLKQTPDPITAMEYYDGNRGRNTLPYHQTTKTRIRPATLQPQCPGRKPQTNMNVIRRTRSEGADHVTRMRALTFTDLQQKVHLETKDGEEPKSNEFLTLAKKQKENGGINMQRISGIHTHGITRIESARGRNTPPSSLSKVFDSDEDVENYIESITLPKIKDCQRRVCKYTCSTCRQRKPKPPCFDIPGLTTKQRRTKAHADGMITKSDTGISEGRISRNDSHNNDLDNISNKVHNYVSKGDNLCWSRKSTMCFEICKKVKHVVPRDGKKASIKRLSELATPRDRVESLHITRASLKRELLRLQQSAPKQTVHTREARAKTAIQQKVGVFLAMLNLQSKNTIPAKMVDIPIREDVMNVDLTAIDLPDRAVQEQPEVNKLLSARRRRHVDFI